MIHRLRPRRAPALERRQADMSTNAWSSSARQRHFAATKILPIGKTRMRANGDLEFMRAANRWKDRCRIAGVKSAGDIRGTNEFENVLIMSGAFSKIGV